MPIYEYNCAKCNKHFEVVQKITDETNANCPTCGSSCKRVMSQTSFSLKGGGWYKDGYSSSSGGKTTEIKKTDKK
ncbi:MAG: FmdB family transcriptional regulator [Deltaproteobacteria bacterium CG11_big_fil_rev_8_21_14_0_20_49_13]|nr:MAG: FmdB family transcriptional regulator [Deltaproteobacteria bacterium CG11_big_fil_rev_8_21_14_0_20_49_13]